MLLKLGVDQAGIKVRAKVHSVNIQLDMEGFNIMCFDEWSEGVLKKVQGDKDCYC